MKNRFNSKLLALVVLMAVCNTGSAWAQAVITSRQEVGAGASTSLPSNATYTVDSSSETYGGAFMNKGTINGSYVTFSGCKAQYSGGAIYNQDASTTLIYATFNNNTLTLTTGNTFGGAFANTAFEASSNATFLGTTSFSGNSGTFGGALHNQGDATTTFKGKVTFGDNKAISSSESVAPNGGAIHNNGASVVFEDEAIFIGNESAKGDGGAIANLKQSSSGLCGNIHFKDKATFKNNKALYPSAPSGTTIYGGAIYNNYATLVFEKDALFEGNTSQTMGGAIAGIYSGSTGSTITFNGKADFKSNQALSCGAIYITRCTLTFNDVTTFTGNSATRGAGAVSASDKSILNLNAKTIFSGNTAIFSSGAMFISGIVNMRDTVVLATETDSVSLSFGTLNWDYSTGKAPLLQNFQYVKNKNKGKLLLSLNPSMQLGDSLIVATGDFSDVTGKDEFTLTGISGLDDVKITINGDSVLYNNLHFMLYTEDDELILKPFICSIGNKGYATFAAAVADVQAGDTLRLVNDITDDNIAIATPNDKAFVLDLNGHKYTNAQKLTASSNITITDAQSGTKGELNVKYLLLSGTESTLSSGSTIYSKEGTTVKANQTLNIIGPGTVFETYYSHTVMGNLNITNASITAGNQIVLFKTASTVLNGDNTLTANNNEDNAVVNMGAFLVQTGTTNIVVKNFFKNEKIGNIIINDGATLDVTSCDSLWNEGTITLKGGKILTKSGCLKNRGKLAWDITEKVATNLDWTMLITNDSALAIMPGLVQPKDTTYTLAEKASNANGQVFTLTGIDGKDDKTITVGGKKVYYGNRLYSLYLSAAANANSRFHGTEGQVRPTALDGGSLILGIEMGICWNVQQEKYYESIQQAFTEAVAGDTVALLTDVELEADLAIPANVCLDLAGFTLTNPDGTDIQWNLTTEPYAALLGLGTLTSAGTLTLNLADNTSCDDCVIATGNVAALTGTAFTLTGVSGLDDVTLTVDGGSIVYGGQSYIFTIEDNDTPTDPTDDALVLLQNYTRKLPRAGVYGTICLNRMIADTEGVEALFVPSWKDDRFIYCIEVLPEETAAAGAYIFKAQEEVDSVVFVRKAKAVYTPVEADNMLGWLAADTVVSEAFIADHDGYAMLAKNEIVTPTPGSTLLKNRALINLDGIGTAMPPKANGRRIVAFGEDGPTAIMTLEEVQILQPVKMIVNGQLIILRDGKKYNAQGIELTD